ncbi:MAG: maleylpyruvate isomerase family mycothiol-dependent enzyme [Ilumatobacteraceae bacterium]
MDRDEYLDHLGADVERFAAALERGPLDAPVPWCGQWRLADLGEHLGDVHRWATRAVLRGTPGEPDPDPAPPDPVGMAAWLRAGAGPLLAVLAAVDLDGPTWHPFPIPKVGAVWPRRQAQETSVHRWDAERAIGLSPTIDAALAADGIDEYFGLALPRVMRREGRTAPAGSLRVQATDSGDEWQVESRDGTIVSAVGDPTVTISGTAQDVLLALWRRPVPDGVVVIDGTDPGWLDLGGM